MGSCFGKCSCSCCDCFVHNPCSSISFCRKVDTPTLVFRRRTSTIEFENLIFDLDIPVCIALPYSSFYLNIFSYSSFFLGFAYSNLLQFFGCSHQSNLNLDLLCIYFWFYSILFFVTSSFSTSSTSSSSFSCSFCFFISLPSVYLRL